MKGWGKVGSDGNYELSVELVILEILSRQLAFALKTVGSVALWESWGSMMGIGEIVLSKENVLRVMSKGP